MTQKQFLTSTAVVVALVFTVAAFIVPNQSTVFVTTDTVTNFPYSLLSDHAKDALK